MPHVGSMAALNEAMAAADARDDARPDHRPNPSGGTPGALIVAVRAEDAVVVYPAARTGRNPWSRSHALRDSPVTPIRPDAIGERDRDGRPGVVTGRRCPFADARRARIGMPRSAHASRPA